MWKFSAGIYIPAKKMMLFKEQTSVEMLLKVCKVPANQKSQSKLSQIGSHISHTVTFCLPLSQLVYKESFT